MKSEANPKLFRELSEPHASKEALEIALEQFFRSVSEARKGFKLQNVAVVVGASYLDGEEELQTLSSLSLGDSMAAEGMYAYAFGDAKRRREEIIARAMAGK